MAMWCQASLWHPVSSRTLPVLPKIAPQGAAPQMSSHPRINYEVRTSSANRMALKDMLPLPLPLPLPQLPALLPQVRWGMRLRVRCSLNGGLSIRSENVPPHPQADRKAENSKGSISTLELGRDGSSLKKKPSYNGIFLILLLNIGIFVADQWLMLPGTQMLYLYHDKPRWYQFITSTFCHLSWNHLSSNLFFLYIFGKLVEEEGGSFAVWMSYLITGVGANLVSWLILPHTVVSAGASGAVFGLFAVSVLVKLSFDWRKILEVLILGQFVVERVMEAAQASAQLGGRVYNSSGNINHIAHLSGALVGVALIWVLKRLPSGDPDKK